MNIQHHCQWDCHPIVRMETSQAIHESFNLRKGMHSSVAPCGLVCLCKQIALWCTCRGPVYPCASGVRENDNFNVQRFTTVPSIKLRLIIKRKVNMFSFWQNKAEYMHICTHFSWFGIWWNRFPCIDNMDCNSVAGCTLKLKNLGFDCLGELMFTWFQFFVLILVKSWNLNINGLNLILT